MVWLVASYFAGSLLALALYVRLAHRLEVPPQSDPEAEWWEAFNQARARLGHPPSQSEVARELPRVA